SIYFGGKNMFPLHLLENGFYGMTFRYEKNRWIQCSKTLQSDDNLLSVDDSSINEASNQLLLYDNNIAQNLTANDILSLQKDLSGEELVDRIVENSTSFTNKTTFAQQKYVSKKKKKHLQQIVVLEPTLFNISESYYNSNPIKIAYDSKHLFNSKK
ncbi:eukaryotic initiation factor 3, gamma subunit protein, partial [Cardiosporidium cionae]